MGGTPIAGWFIMDSLTIPLKWMIWGYPHFRKLPYCNLGNPMQPTMTGDDHENCDIWDGVLLGLPGISVHVQAYHDLSWRCKTAFPAFSLDLGCIPSPIGENETSLASRRMRPLSSWIAGGSRVHAPRPDITMTMKCELMHDDR